MDRSITGPAEFIQTNVVGTFSLLTRVARLLQGPSRGRGSAAYRHVQVSTDEVYGSLGPTRKIQRDDARWRRTRPTRPPRPARICSRAPGSTPTACPRSRPTARTTTARASFPEKLIPHMIHCALDRKTASRLRRRRKRARLDPRRGSLRGRAARAREAASPARLTASAETPSAATSTSCETICRHLDELRPRKDGKPHASGSRSSPIASATTAATRSTTRARARELGFARADSDFRRNGPRQATVRVVSRRNRRAWCAARV